MFKFLLSILSLWLLVGSTNPNSHNLEIKVSGIESSKGEICVALFRTEDADAFPEDIDKLFQYKIVKVQTPSTTIEFEGLKPGIYAYSIVQDYNGNRFTDKNLVGYPVEPFGFSTNFKPLFSAPDFEDCAFELNADMTHVIELID